MYESWVWVWVGGEGPYPLVSNDSWVRTFCERIGVGKRGHRVMGVLTRRKWCRLEGVGLWVAERDPPLESYDSQGGSSLNCGGTGVGKRGWGGGWRRWDPPLESNDSLGGCSWDCGGIGVG